MDAIEDSIKSFASIPWPVVSHVPGFKSCNFVSCCVSRGFADVVGCEGTEEDFGDGSTRVFRYFLTVAEMKELRNSLLV